MTDYTTTIATQLNRIVDSLVDEIANDGLQILKKILDSSGFAKSEYLKDYEIYAHVDVHEITFEILVNLEAIEMDEEVQERIQSEQKKIQERLESKAIRTYGMSKHGNTRRIVGQRDAKKPTQDARRPARRRTGGLKTADNRLEEHEVALRAPRSIRVNREGKLSLSFKRSLRENKQTGEIIYPKEKFDGIMNDFINQIQDLIADKFIPELGKFIERNV